jgi:hypothetical protein
MWETALKLSEDDKWMIDAWVGDANGILAFVSLNLLVRLFIIFKLMRSFKTGLLSATVGAFIIEFYKMLSPDPGGQTVDLLGQISQQLTNSRNGTSITAANQPFSPSVQMIWVNAMWLISLVFSLSSALITSLNQQAVRRYIEMLKDPSKEIDHARVRLLLFRGVKVYKMPLAILAAPTLLHLSILLFFGGLVIVFHTIYEKVAIAVDVAVGVSGLVYMTMSLLPLVDPKCPYRTPVTYLLRYLWVTFRFFAEFCGLLPFAMRLPGCSCLCPRTCTCLVPQLPLGSDGSDGAGSGKQDMVPCLSKSPGKAVEEKRGYLTDGFRERVINDATNPQEHEDRKTITWLFKHFSRSDENKFIEFAACIPRTRVVDLIQPIKSGNIHLRKPLEVLLRSCTYNTGAGDLDEAVRRSALRVCLIAIHDIAKEPIIPDLNFVRGKLANIILKRGLTDDKDDSIRITSRSICALVARQVLSRKKRLENADLSWLEELTREQSNATGIREAEGAVRDMMNFKFFVYGMPPNYANHLLPKDAISFMQTLATLLGIGTNNPTTEADLQPQLSEAVGRVQQYDPERVPEVLYRLRFVFPSLSAPPPIFPEASPHSGTPQSSPHRGPPQSSPHRGPPQSSPHRGTPHAYLRRGTRQAYLHRGTPQTSPPPLVTPSPRPTPPPSAPPPPRITPRPPSHRRRPPADPSPSPSAAPTPPSVPPTSHIASPPPHSNPRSYTARPPYEPI